MEIWTKLLTIALVALTVSSCSDSKESNHLDPIKDEEPFANTRTYRPEAPIAAMALDCVKAEEEADSCTLNQLAPIAFDNPSPSIDEVMDRVLVSHDWMGERFEQLLVRMPDDILYLLGGVTAIVIDDDIRPSYYTALTGAIYLDPDGLWLTPDEYAVIDSAPDYRAAYAEVMAFRSFWRYVIPGASDTRTIDSLETDLASLLFHELAHANDLFPRGQYDQANGNDTILDAITAISEQSLADEFANFHSSQLAAQQPLLSEMMSRIAAILFLGETASQSERMYTAAQVGAEFADDGANDEYAYTSQYEDLAMLFEEAMMKLHYGADRDIAFANLPSAGDNNVVCDDYKVGWGVRNRIGDAVVKERAEWVVNRLLPHRDYTMLFNLLDEPAVIPNGLGWCASEGFENVAAAKSEKSFAPETSQEALDLRDTLPRSELRFR